jgi:hypothetical protein
MGLYSLRLMTRLFPPNQEDMSSVIHTAIAVLDAPAAGSRLLRRVDNR